MTGYCEWADTGVPKTDLLWMGGWANPMGTSLKQNKKCEHLPSVFVSDWLSDNQTRGIRWNCGKCFHFFNLLVKWSEPGFPFWLPASVP